MVFFQVARLSLRSGSTLSSAVRRVLQGLMSDEVAKTFNWKGSRGEKMGIQQTGLAGVIYGNILH